MATDPPLTPESEKLLAGALSVPMFPTRTIIGGWTESTLRPALARVEAAVRAERTTQLDPRHGLRHDHPLDEPCSWGAGAEAQLLALRTVVEAAVAWADEFAKIESWETPPFNKPTPDWRKGIAAAKELRRAVDAYLALSELDGTPVKP